MMKRLLNKHLACKGVFLWLLIAFTLPSKAQQFSLYNTHTLFDSFENPSQKAFLADSSRKYAFNFFVPNGGFNMAFQGPAQSSFKILLTRQATSAHGTDLTDQTQNKLFVNSNIYIAMFRIFKSLKFNKELGFSWQLRGDGNVDRLTNQTFGLLDNYSKISGNNFNDIFNEKASAQSYHQFSIAYREDVDKRLSIGFKVSYLSGIGFQDVDIKESSFSIPSSGESTNTTDAYTIYLRGRLRENFEYSRYNQISFLPGIKNPGLGFSAGASIKLRDGWLVLGNLKDIGFIRWNNKNSRRFLINNSITVNNASSANSEVRLFTKLDSAINTTAVKGSFVTPINGKIEVLINKDYYNYQPNFLISKNIFYKGLDIGMTNAYKVGLFNFSLSTVYNTLNIFEVGLMGMLRTPNFEVFGGSDQLIKTAHLGKGIIKSNEVFGTGYTGGSFYLGFSLKFGQNMMHPSNSNVIPGFEDYYNNKKDETSFFNQLFKKKKKTN